MAFGIGDNLFKLMQEFNPWWKTGSIPMYYKNKHIRAFFKKSVSMIMSSSIRRNILFNGARGTGKTTVIHQIIDQLLLSGISPEKIIYVSYDHPLIKLHSIEIILEIYFGVVNNSEDIYLFIDEMEYAHDGLKYLNDTFDTHPLRRVICSTSVANSDFINHISGSDIIWSCFPVHTFSFYEFCLLKNADFPEMDSAITLNEIFQLFPEDYERELKKLEPLSMVFNQYLFSGGFPSLVLSQSDEFTQRLMCAEIIDKIIKQDIPALYKIRQPDLLEKVFLYLCFHSGEIINMTTMSRALNNTPAITLQNYIEFLSQANIIYVSNPMSFNGKLIQKPKSKIYIADPSIRSALLMLSKTDLIGQSSEIETIIETLVHKQLISYFQRTPSSVGYYKASSSESKTIDMVVDTPQGRHITDIRYMADSPLTKKDILINIASNTTSTILSAYLLTRKTDDYNLKIDINHSRIAVMPSFMYLFIMGREEYLKD